jgi:tight adherence protein B
MIPLLVVMVFAGTFVAAAIAVILAAAFRYRGASAVPEDDSEGAGMFPALLKQEQLSTMPVWRQILEYLDWSAFLKDRIEQAGMQWSVGRVTLTMLLLGAVFFALLFDVSWAPTGVAFVAAFAAASLPYWFIDAKRGKRLRKIEEQFPDALDSLARAMRAGHALSGAMMALAGETPAPLGPELRRLADEHRLGLSWELVLEHFAGRIPIHEVRLFAAAIQVQTRTGGKLTEVLERLGINLRETAALRGEIRAISAQGRLTGSILTLMPVFIAGAMYFTNPAYIHVLLDHPYGKTLIWCALGCVATGHFVIQRIVEIRLPQ